jgi:hypothetical protein
LTDRTVVSKGNPSIDISLVFTWVSQVLVTHHVDLVLPGAHYLVRMLDGRIDTQGAVADLQAQGVLEGIERSAVIDANKGDLSLVESKAVEQTLDDDTPKLDKKPRKLIKDEHRETGGVKWSNYKSYLKASYVIPKTPVCLLMSSVRSYWTWVILTLLIVISQLLVVGEKLWIMVRLE